ncbi:MAG: hypothetical protein U0T84_11980 [Chitinophagales bacterium]
MMAQLKSDELAQQCYVTGQLKIEASAPERLTFYNILGATIAEIDFIEGISSLDMMKLPIGVLLYQARLGGIHLFQGKIVVK